MSPGLARTPVLRFVAFKFGWNGITGRCLWGGACAALAVTFLAWWVMFMFHVGSAWRIVEAGVIVGVGIETAICVAQWKRDPNYLPRLMNASECPHVLSPYLADAKDPCVLLAEFNS